MRTLKQTYQINSPVAKVWQALVDPKEINLWGGGPAKMSDREGTEFSLWGGDIHGKNIEIIPGEKLIQEWFGGDWAKPSKVVFTLTAKGKGTKLDLLQTDVPNEEAKDIAAGWKSYYLGQLKKLLEK